MSEAAPPAPPVGLADLLAPGAWDDPYPLYRRMREEDSPEARVLTRYADVLVALRDPRLSSDRVSTIMKPLPPEARAELGPLRDTIAAQLPFSDPPAHTRLRSLVNRAFTPRTAEALRPTVQRLADEMLDTVAERGGMDVVADLAYPLPALVIAEMLGVPREDADRFKDWAANLVLFVGSGRRTAELGYRTQESVFEMREYMSALAARRRADPRDDLLTALLAAEEEGDRLGEDELFANCLFLMTAGHETATNLLANGVLLLLRHPDQAARLRADPGLVASAVEEMLRYESPVQMTARLAREDGVVLGRRLEAGQALVLVLAAANRDPERFADPERFDVARPDNRHLAFGHGPHHCLGAPLARAEGQVVVATVLRRFPDLALAADSVEWQDTLDFRGLRALPVAF